MDDRIVGSGKVALRAFHLDDPGARIRQPRRAVRRSDGLLHRDDEHASSGLSASRAIYFSSEKTTHSARSPFG